MNFNQVLTSIGSGMEADGADQGVFLVQESCGAVLCLGVVYS